MKISKSIIRCLLSSCHVLFICFLSAIAYSQPEGVCVDESVFVICDHNDLVLQAIIYTDAKFIEEDYNNDQAAAFLDLEQKFLASIQVYTNAVINLDGRVEAVYILEEEDLLADISGANPSQLSSFCGQLSARNNAIHPCPNADIIVYYTGYNIGVNGAYYSHGLCNPDKDLPLNNYKVPAAIIRDGSLTTTAHEVGHMLGLQHIDEGALPDCSDCCIGLQPIMCSTGSGVEDPADFFITTCNMERLENLPCDCLSESTICTKCDIVMEGKSLPQVYEYIDCESPEEIEYTIKVCNDCYEGDYKIIAKNFDIETQIVSSSNTFSEITSVNADWYITGEISFEPEECKEFIIRTTPAEPTSLETELALTFVLIESNDNIFDVQTNGETVAVKVVKNIDKIKSSFHFQNEFGSLKDVFCDTEEIYVDGSESKFEDEFRFKVSRRLIGTQSFTFLFQSDWYENDIENFPFVEMANSNGHVIEAGYEYEVIMEVRNSCNPKSKLTRHFTTVDNCCMAPSWMSCLFQNGGVVLTWEDSSPNSEYYIYIDEINACCGEDDQLDPIAIEVDDNQYKLPGGKYECLEWWVISKCDDSNSSSSERQCHFSNTPCLSFMETAGSLDETLVTLLNEQLQVEGNSVEDATLLSINTIDQDLIITPNPFTNSITLEFYSKTVDMYTVEIYDLQGNIVFTSKLNALRGKNTIQFSIDDGLLSGMYILSLTNEKGQRVTKRITKI